MGKLLRHDPTAVIAQLSAWLSDEESPGFWAPFALSIRGLAYEVMDECELARMDYIEGLRLYDAMTAELGKEPVERMGSNINFVRFRLGNLPPPPPPLDSVALPAFDSEPPTVPDDDVANGANGDDQPGQPPDPDPDNNAAGGDTPPDPVGDASGDGPDGPGPE